MLIDEYAGILKHGGVVAFPTETVYGLGADALNPDAVKKVFDLKGRPADNPLIVHLSSIKTASAFTDDLNADTQKLMNEFWPGPLTIVLRKKPSVLDIVTAGLDTVALRMPDHELALQLIKISGPLVAPSANISGKPSPTRVEHVIQDMGNDFPVLNGGPCRIGLESTVLDMSSEPYTILRPGYVGLKELEAILKKSVIMADRHKTKNARSPGMKYSHYKPDANVRWMHEDELPDKQSVMYIYPALTGADPGKPNIFWYRGDFEELGRDLYDRFRQADIQGYGEVAIEKFDQQDALLNRIRKAIGKD